MHARVITAQSSRNRMEDAVTVYRDAVIPEASAQKGFKHAYLLVDTESEQAVSIVLWETEQDMIAGEASEYLRGQIAKFGAIFNGPPSVEHYEVRVMA